MAEAEAASARPADSGVALDDGQPVGIGTVERGRDRLRHFDGGPSKPVVDGSLDAHPEDPARERELLDPAITDRREADETVVSEAVVDADRDRANSQDRRAVT